MNFEFDKRTVLTLDAGGTNFVFSAIRANEEIVDPVVLPAEAKVLHRSLETMVSGFLQVIEKLDDMPVAISFAFPGPADYPNGIIDNVGNLPAFAGGVALGPYLEEQFGMPVYINNDGNLFVYGEAIAGLLPKVNTLLKEAGSPKHYNTLFGITLGTGFGGGLVHRGELFIGDNSNATEVWLMRNKVHPECIAEEGASIRAVQGAYARKVGISFDDAPTPKEIGDISRGLEPGDRIAAKAAFNELGEVVGDALANCTTLFDGLVVIGGGISLSHELFMPALVEEMQGTIKKYDGSETDRIVQKVYNLEEDEQVKEFLTGQAKEITVPGSGRKISYDPLKRIGVGVSSLGTSQAVSIGAYAFALHEVDKEPGC